MTLARKVGLGLVALAGLLLAGVFWALGTDSGTRFLLGRAAPYLPAQLTLGTASGSVLGGICMSSASWRTDAQDISLRDICVDIEMAQLLSKHLAVRSLDVGETTIELYETTADDPPGGLPAVEAPLRISVASSSLRNLSIRREQLQREVERIEFSGSLRGSKLDITGLTVRSNWLDLDLDGGATLAEPYPGRLNMTWEWVTSPSLVLAGNLQLRGDLERYELMHTLSLPQRLVTRGSVSYSTERLTLDLANTWNLFEWQVDDSLVRSSSGLLGVHGEPTRLQVTLDGMGTLNDLPETRVMLDGETDLESLRFSSLSASNELGQLESSGSVRWVPEPGFDIEYALSNIDPSFASDRLQGQVNLAGTANGTLRADDPELMVQVSKADGTLNGHALDGSAGIGYASKQLRVSNAKVRLGSNQLSLRGNAGDTVSLYAELNAPALAELLPDVAGSASGVLILENSQRISADLNLRDLEIRDTEIASARVGIEGSLDQHSIKTELSGLGNTVTAEMRGAFADKAWSGTIVGLSVINELAGDWALREPGQLTASDQGFSLSRICLERSLESGEVCTEVTVAQARPTLFDLEIRDLPLAQLPLALPASVTLNGFGNMRASGSVIDRRMTGDVSVSLREASVDAVVDDEELSTVFDVASGVATLSDNQLDAALQLTFADGAGNTRAELTVEDILDFGSGISGNSSVAINDLSLVAIFVPGLSNPSGTVNGNLQISGTLGEPDFLGVIAVSDGAFSVRQAGIDVTDFNVQLSQSSPGRLTLEGSSKSGGGEIRITGDTWVSADTGIRSEVLVTGQDFELIRLPDLQLAASPAIAMVFDEQKTSVTGNLLVPVASIRMKRVPETAVSPSTDTIVHGEEGLSVSDRRRIDVDIAVGLGEEVSFDGFGLTTNIDGVVRLRGGTHQQYTGSGKLSLREGRYEAYGQELEIERGQLIFNGPLDNPQLDVRAVRRTTDVVAGIQLSGTPSQLRSSVFSEPALGDAEALSYLLTGRPLSSATSQGDGDTLNAAAFALGLSGAGNIVSQVRSGLGLETLALEGGAEDSRLIAGKRFGNRLLVEYGYGLVDKLGTLLLRYQLTDRLVLESRTGTVSNFDILYRVKKK